MVIRCLSSVFAVVLALSAAPSFAADEVLTTPKGVVTLGGQPLAAGKITFYLDDDQFVGAKIKDGAYKIRRVPVGVWRVVIEGEGVPQAFQSEKSSGFTVEVKPGENEFDFDIKRTRR